MFPPLPHELYKSGPVYFSGDREDLLIVHIGEASYENPEEARKRLRKRAMERPAEEKELISRLAKSIWRENKD